MALPGKKSTNVAGYLSFEAYMNQMVIGWDQAFRGSLSIKWRKGYHSIKH